MLQINPNNGQVFLDKKILSESEILLHLSRHIEILPNSGKLSMKSVVLIFEKYPSLSKVIQGFESFTSAMAIEKDKETSPTDKIDALILRRYTSVTKSEMTETKIKSVNKKRGSSGKLQFKMFESSFEDKPSIDVNSGVYLSGRAIGEDLDFSLMTFNLWELKELPIIVEKDEVFLTEIPANKERTDQDFANSKQERIYNKQISISLLEFLETIMLEVNFR